MCVASFLLSFFVFVGGSLLTLLAQVPELEWEWRFAEPTPHTMNGIHFFNDRVGIMAGTSGTILRTTDGGVSWEILRGGTRWDFIDVVPQGEDRVWLLSGDTNILITTDQGMTWRTPEDLRKRFIMRMNFLDEQTGFALSYADTIYRTEDGGETWRNTGKTLPRYLNRFSICFVDTSVWLCGQDNGDIYRTSDGGITWEKTSREKEFSELIASIAVSDDGTLYAVGSRAQFLRSDDGGLTWTSPPDLGYSGNAEKVKIIAGKILIHGSTRPLVSVDGGETFNHPHNEDPNYIQAFAMTVIGNRIWMTGDRGQILSSDDNGRSWQSSFIIKRLEPTGLLFFDQETGLMSSRYESKYGSSFFRTTDGGKTWEFDDRSTDWISIHGMERVGDHVWMFGYGGAIYYSGDRGETWETQSKGAIGGEELVAISFADQLHGYAVTEDGLLMRTQDGGDFWELREFYEFDTRCTDISAPSPDSVWISTAAGYMLLSTDGGTSFSKSVVFKNTNPPSIYAVQFVDPMVGWITPYHEGIMRTTDGGASWHQLYSGLTTFSSMDFLDRHHGIATVQNEVWLTDNGGETWQRNADQLGKLSTVLSYIDEYGLWAVTSVGGLLHAEYSFLTVADPPSPPFLQSYPNPASGRITVAGLPVQGQTYTAVLTNAIGREVLRDAVRSAGGKVTISLQGLSAGGYFLRLRGPGGIFECRFVIVE